MKILFVENRYATVIWNAVAGDLEKCGHEIHWIVQNPLFRPTVGVVHVLPFPSKKEKKKNESLSWLKHIDRGVRWFGGDGKHWDPYNERIREVLELVRPDVVFGEPTQFHEQLTLENARQLGIRFLSPSGTRYPIERLHFFDYDTLEPIGGEGVALSDGDLEKMLNSIIDRRIVPSYMQVVNKSKLEKLWSMLKNKSLITVGWFMGERYITPSPFIKMRLERAHKKRCSNWEEFAHKKLPESLNERSWVLYPLQMQPEANIELWGKPWSYQADIIKRAAKSLENIGATLVIKPNPKSKYELSDNLCELIRQAPNIIALSHAMPMKDVFPHAPLVMTVTGTVTLECIFSGKPIAVLGTHAMTYYKGVEKISKPEEISGVLEKINSNMINIASRDDAKSLLSYLHQKSYPAMLWHQLDRPELMTESNVSALTRAFSSVLAHINDSKSRKNQVEIY